MYGRSWGNGGGGPNGVVVPAGQAAQADPYRGAQPYPPTLDNAMAALDPPSMLSRSRQGLQWYRQPVLEPMPYFPADPNISQQPRRFVTQFVNEVANVEKVNLIQVDIPCVVYALTGGAFNSDTSEGAGRDTWAVRFEHSTGDRLDSSPAIAEALVGTGQFPALIGGVGWNFDRGATVKVAVTPFIPTLIIWVACWIIEVRGPTNYGALG